MSSASRRAGGSRVLLWLRALGGSYWFVPTVLTAAAIGLSYGMLWLDHRYVGQSATTVFYGGDAAGARAVLGTIAGSMITVAGVVFSITIVALSLASQQFGPTLLKNFMNDRPNQFVLGTFVATFIYCLLVLRGVNAGEAFVPHISVTVSLVLAVVSLGVLIFFIHHIATSIRPEGLLARVAAELKTATESLYPERLGRPDGEVSPRARRDLERGAVVRAPRDGYVEIIADGTLLDVARRRDLVVEILIVPGQFVVRDLPIARVHPPDALDDGVRSELEGVIVIGDRKDGSDRVHEAFDELVQLCLRALSPSLNDPLTAFAALDRITAGLARVARASVPSEARFDEDGTLRVLAPRASFDGLVRRALDPVRCNAGRQANVVTYLVDCVAKLAWSTPGEAQWRVLRDFLRRLERTAERDLLPSDAERALPELRRLARAVDDRSAGGVPAAIHA